MKKLNRKSVVANMQNRALSIIKDRSGESFVFVLGLMMFLLAIGASVLVAANTNFGLAVNQRVYSQTMILGDSIHKNILYSLQHDPADESLLSAQLVMEIYNASAPGLAWGYRDSVSIPVEISLDKGADLGSGHIKVAGITFSLQTPPEECVKTIQQPRPEIDIPAVLNEDGSVSVDSYYEPRRPRVDTVNMIVTAIVEINAGGKIITSKATYSYTGGKLDDSVAEGIMAFTADGAGRWRLIKHENIDSKDQTS